MSKAFGGCRRQFSNAGNLQSNLKRNENMRNNLHPRQFFARHARTPYYYLFLFGFCRYVYTSYAKNRRVCIIFDWFSAIWDRIIFY